jgi:LynF/TruF/PatF family peptide O-prenyltransferase
MNTNSTYSEIFDKYNRHISLFHISNSTVSDAFFSTFSKIKGANLECSVKVDGDVIYPSRYNFWFYGNYEDVFFSIADFLNYLSSQSDISISKQALFDVFGNLDSSLLLSVVVGVDLRLSVQQSRFKVWIITKSKKVIDDFFSKDTRNECLRSFIFEDYVLLGVDLFFDSKVGFKIYPFFIRSLFPKLLGLFDVSFSQKLSVLLNYTKKLHITLDSSKSQIIFDFSPSNMDDFLSCLPLSFKNKMDSLKIPYLETGYISFLKEEIISKDIIIFNFYY